MLPTLPHVYPVFLLLRERLVLVVGAGAIAERKIASLLEAGAKVRVVATRAAGRGRVARGPRRDRAQAPRVRGE
ncbi:MAG: NAD(P)-dependent oxidoreductase [Polyangiaceae bacterium]|nr:NAD(P)-dependent oxidoreductase [Polyangiaceae bacterium]